MNARMEFAERLVTGTAARNQQAFAEWASCYDTQPNPLLMLEERYLRRLFPEISGRDVLDAGCGSGRWLPFFADRNPRSLTGIDASGKMLEVATGKGIAAELLACSCENTPLCSERFDLILSSFVLSYIEDLSRFAAEMSRIARAGCDLFLSDMHPETKRQLAWRRSFSTDRGEIELNTQEYDLQNILRCFTDAGWTLCAALDPEFGSPEHEVFLGAKRLHSFEAATGRPAIYIFHLRKSPEAPRATLAGSSATEKSICLWNCRWAIGPAEDQNGHLKIERGKVEFLASERMRLLLPLTSANLDIDLSGYLLLPGLINAHDHLEFSLFPRLGARRYDNATDWAEDIHKRFGETISLYRSVPLRTRLWWGGLRNLLCGVTTVCHHNPLRPELESEDFPVRVIRNYGWAHSLRYGGDLRAAYAATAVGAPFVLHASEGTDEQAGAEVGELDSLGILDNRTVVVHGLALDAESAEILERRGASLIICPSSNAFLFDTVPAADILESIEAIALGSDSPLTACGDLLDEIRFAVSNCYLSPGRVYSMVTDAAAAILRLPDGEGLLRISSPGDIIAVRDSGRSPAETLSSLSMREIELVVRDGRVHLASEGVLARLPAIARDELEPLCIEGTTRWLRAPIGEIFAQTEKILGTVQLKLGGKPVWLPDPA